MTFYDYKLGTTYAGLTNVETITDGKAPTSVLSEWSVVSDKGDGLAGGHGFPTARWTFGGLEQTGIDALRAYCPGKSANIWINTRTPAGTFQVYQAVMLWPDEPMSSRRFTGVYAPFTIEFRYLRPYTWWLAGGIDPSSVDGAYVALGAASKAASLINLADPGTNDLTEAGTVTWSAVAGWSGFSAANYLQSAFPPDDNRGIILRVATMTGTVIGIGACGVWDTTNALGMTLRTSARVARRGSSGSTSFGASTIAALTAGVIRSSNSSRQRAWANTSFTAISDNTAITSAINMPIGRTVDGAGTYVDYFAGYILAAVIYNAALTDDQAAAVINDINAFS